VTRPRVRPIEPADLPAVVAMVHELAAYERAPAECRLTEPQLAAALFAERPALYGHVALDGDGLPAGLALWFLNFSTWRGEHGIYLEDLYVRMGGLGAGIVELGVQWSRSRLAGLEPNDLSPEQLRYALSLVGAQEMAARRHGVDLEAGRAEARSRLVELRTAERST